MFRRLLNWHAYLQNVETMSLQNVLEEGDRYFGPVDPNIIVHVPKHFGKDSDVLPRL